MSETSTPEPAHDVLAAEAFAMPAPDPRLHPHPLDVPQDPAGGDATPHDVLAAEEFPMPAAHVGGGFVLTRAEHRRRLGVSAVAGGAVALLLRRLLAHRR
jgi:hypothetical protein